MIAPRPRLTAALLGLVIAGALEAPSKRFAWVTIANDSARYKAMAIVLFSSLRRFETRADCVLLCAGCALDPRERQLLASLRVVVRNTSNPVVLAPDAEARLFGDHKEHERLTQRTGAGDFIKLRAHALVAYERVVLLDADMLALAHADELFDAEEGAHCNGPRSPLNAGLVVIAPRLGDFEELVRTALAANYSKQSGWRGEGPCRNMRGKRASELSNGCQNRHIMQGLWHWWFVSRHVPPGDRIALRAAEDRLLLPRDRYNALQDEPSRGSSYSNITFVHFWNCQGEIGAANECAGAGTHRDATAGLRRGLRKKSPLWRETLCTRAWRAWSAELEHVCAAALPPRSSCCHALSPEA